jgi:parvulin-like peptidyl-prolyl isomerase
MKRIVIQLFASACICYLSLPLYHALAQKADVSTQEIVATVDDEPIYAAEVNRLLNKVARGRDVNPAALPLLQSRALQEIIDRRLVLAYARRTKSAPTSEEVDSELNKLKSGLVARRQSLDEYLNSQSITEADLRRQVTWNLIWERYLAKYITDSRLESYFQAHRRDFDGTQVSVSHILLRPQKNDDPSDWDDLSRNAAAIRQEIILGKISFVEAAQKYSAGPSAKDGGALGFIPRHGVMDEAFSRAAFALEVGQVSEPVRTPFGEHLIRCNEIKPGAKQLNDIRKELEDGLSRELLDELARQQHGFTTVKYTGKTPYLKPGTRGLVVP